MKEIEDEYEFDDPSDYRNDWKAEKLSACTLHFNGIVAIKRLIRRRRDTCEDLPIATK